MINEEYSMNSDALKEILDFFTITRESLNISQRFVAERIDVSNVEIHKLETGKRMIPGLQTIFKLCSFYNLSEEQIIEFYKALCHKNSKPFIIDKNISFKTNKVELEISVLNELKIFFLNRRLEVGLSQRDLARTIGLSNAEISRIESETENKKRKNLTLYSLIPLCKYYHVSEEQVVEFYYKVTKNNSICKETNDIMSKLEKLSKQQLIEIILNQNNELEKSNKQINGDKKVLRRSLV